MNTQNVVEYLFELALKQDIDTRETLAEMDKVFNQALATARAEALSEFQACYDELRKWAWNNIDASGNVDFDRMVERHTAILSDKQEAKP